MSGRGFVTHVLEPAQLGVWVDPAPGGREVPHTAREALAALPQAVAVLDGPMFRIADPAHPDYRRYRAGKIDYHVVDRALGIEDDGGSATDTRGITLSVLGNAAFVAKGDRVAEGADVAVQLYPSLIENGVVVASPSVNADEVWRAGVGLRADGKLILAVGRGTMRWFAEQLAAAGATQAGYTDGGGSTRLETRERFWGSTENRRVVCWLFAKAL